jgi:phosphoribosylcarboxyaminoimidazole (NCAIR) mutase
MATIPNPLVSIIMGSSSDLPVMEQAAAVLAELNVPYEMTVVSAHRTPERMVEHAAAAACSMTGRSLDDPMIMLTSGLGMVAIDN